MTLSMLLQFALFTTFMIWYVCTQTYAVKFPNTTLIAKECGEVFNAWEMKKWMINTGLDLTIAKCVDDYPTYPSYYTWIMGSEIFIWGECDCYTAPNATKEECTLCFNIVKNDLMKFCPFSREANIITSDCLLRYSFEEPWWCDVQPPLPSQWKPPNLGE